MPDQRKKPDVRVIKANAYPIPCRIILEQGKPALAGSIQRLEEFGFIFRSVGYFYRVGEELSCEFEIPISEIRVVQPIKVIKTVESIEAYLAGGEKEKIMTVEVHFKTKLGDFQKHIIDYLVKINQRLK
jgi:hypothetical protein